MATLWKKAAGFRFPYPKWVESSTPKNLVFLEALLEKYLHIHETVNNVLYVTNRGFRMPYKKTVPSLEENMKVVEMQLEQALHEHEVATVSTTETEESSTTPIPAGDRGFEESTLVSSGYRDDVANLTPNQWHDGNSRPGDGGTVEILSGGAAEGDNYVQVTHASANLNDFHSLQYRIDLDEPTPADAEGSFSIQVRGEWANGEFSIHQYDSDLNEMGTISIADPGLSASYGDWTTLTTPDAAPSSGVSVFEIELVIVVTNGQSADVDDLQWTYTTEEETTTNVDTLFTNHKGFRFPYDWKSEQQIRMNMDHLETQITKFLHKHETVT